FCLAVALCCVASAAAADPPVGEESPGWLGWSMNLDETRPPRGLEQAEFEALLSIIEEIGALFRSTPYLNRPRNAEISPWRTTLPRVGMATSRESLRLAPGDAALPARHPLREWPPAGSTRDEAGGGGPLRAAFRLGIYRPDYHPLNLIGTVEVQINDPWMEGRLVFEDEEGGIYLQWPRLESRNGRLRYRIDAKTVVEKFLPPGREAWTPVSQERWIRLLIAKTEHELERFHEEITTDARTRRENFERSYEALKSLDAEQAAQMRETFEQSEAQYALLAEAIAAEDYDALEAAGDRGRAMMGRHKLTLEEELASLSAAERRAPAYGFASDPAMYWMPPRAPERPSLLLSPDDPEALPLIAPDPEFFRPDLPATAIQSLTIVNKLPPEFAERLEEELDWAALAAMVR
ncbi:MAG: hypothetical protein ACLFSP_10750, partial [Spirochaetaceae bacterium]